MTVINTDPPLPAKAAAPTGSGTNITSDFNTFLTLLTTQMRHQDPLNPMSSTEFATQLATFSGVEQQVRTNEQLASILAQNGLTTLAQLGNWVEMEVLTNAPARFAGQPLQLEGAAAAGADQANLIVRDAAGRELQRLAVALPVEGLTWDGARADGRPFPNGTYGFELESLQAGAVIATTKLHHFARVAEARTSETGVSLVLAGGGSVEASAVSGLRNPPG